MADEFKEVVLAVNGVRYSGWKSIRATDSMESIANSFAFDVSDRWNGNDRWPIVEEDECQVYIGDQLLLDGWVDKRRLAGSKDSRALGYEGKSRAGALVECSAIVDAGTAGKGGKWSFNNVDVVDLATKIAAAFGIRVSVQPGLGRLLTKQAKIVLHPGDTGFEIISRTAAAAGVLAVSDGEGGIVITRASAERASPLIEGWNILSASVEYDASDRFYKYLISSQVPGTDEASGDDTRIQAEAFDLGVKRTDRVLLIRPDKSYSTADAKRRADWEARIRAARAEKVSVSVQGWAQQDGQLWRKNTVSRVQAPDLIGVDGDLLISQVEYTVGDGGRITQLSLVRPDAFTPEPSATVKESGGLWKELAKGAL